MRHKKSIKVLLPKPRSLINRLVTFHRPVCCGCWFERWCVGKYLDRLYGSLYYTINSRKVNVKIMFLSTHSFIRLLFYSSHSKILSLGHDWYGIVDIVKITKVKEVKGSIIHTRLPFFENLHYSYPYINIIKWQGIAGINLYRRTYLWTILWLYWMSPTKIKCS